MIRMSKLFAIALGLVAMGSVAISTPAAAFSGTHNEQMSVASAFPRPPVEFVGPSAAPAIG